jgi:hypothetical protein
MRRQIWLGESSQIELVAIWSIADFVCIICVGISRTSAVCMASCLANDIGLTTWSSLHASPILDNQRVPDMLDFITVIDWPFHSFETGASASIPGSSRS